MNNKTLLYAAAVAGAFTGLLSGIPIINMLNCFFCGWVWVGGVGSVWLYNQREGGSLTGGNSALAGALTGAVAAVIAAFLGFVFGVGTAALSRFSPQLRDYLPDIATTLLGGAFSFVFNIIFFTLFGALGGLIGGELFKKK